MTNVRLDLAALKPATGKQEAFYLFIFLKVGHSPWWLPLNLFSPFFKKNFKGNFGILIKFSIYGYLL